VYISPSNNIEHTEGEILHQQETTAFHSETPGWVADIGQTSSDHDLVSAQHEELAEFFSRPLLTREINWAVGSQLDLRFDPWSDYFNHKRVINRINNYYHLRCRLHVRFLINGNSFLYTNCIVFYTPLPLTDSYDNEDTTALADLTMRSQRPHIYLDPTISKGGDMILPFFYPYNALSIPDANWFEMGRLSLRSFGALTHVSSNTGNVVISVFTWAEDVSLNIPTGLNSAAIIPQAGPAGEYASSTISQPMMALAAWAGNMKNIPYIAPYARATEIGASAVGTIAKLFGYSRPVQLADQHDTQVNSYGNIAITNAKEVTNKLTLDAKSELNIDTRTMGLSGEDEMAILNIAQKESFINLTSWGSADIPGKVIFQTYVNPIQNTAIAGTYRYPAISMVTSFFEKWRGGIRFRFMIMASAFHKGRLRISYDPVSGNLPDYNVSFNRIIDLATDRDFVIEVPYASLRPWCENLRDLRDRRKIRDANNNGVLDPMVKSSDNGFITVSVLNRLTVPNDLDKQVRIAVFISAADDFQVAEPTSTKIGDFSPTPVPQSGKDPGYSTTDPVAPEIDPPEEPVIYKLFETKPLTKDETTFFCDPIVSFRQILRRYDFLGILPLPRDEYAYYSQRLNNLPIFRGTYQTAGQPNSVYINRGTPLIVLSSCFAAWRGSIRYKYLCGSSADNANAFLIARGVRGVGEVADLVDIPASDAIAQRTEAAYQGRPDYFRGAATNFRSANNCISVEIPYYDNRRFDSTRVGPTNPQLQHTVYLKWRTDNITKSEIDRLIAIGEDFQLGFWLGPPRFRVVSTSQLIGEL